MLVSGHYRLWRAWKTVVEMLADRKYFIPKEVRDRSMTYESYIKDNPVDEELSKIRSKFQETFSCKEGEPASIVVLMRESVGNSQVQEIYNILQNLEVNDAIVVYTDKITPSADTAIKHLKVKKVNLECFTEASLQYNITHHEKVPKHIICSLATKNSVMEKYHTDKDHISQIKVTDPVCRYLGAKKGQLIEIVRRSDSISEVDETEIDEKGVEVVTRKKLYDIAYKIVV